MWHLQSFIIGALLGLTLVGCSGSSFEADSSQSQVLSVEVDDANVAGKAEDSLDASSAGTQKDSVDSASSAGSSTSASNTLEDATGSCASSLHAAPSMVRVAGSQKTVTINSQELVLSRVTGDRNQLLITLKGNKSSAKLAGLCLFVAGHENKVQIRLEHPVAGLAIRARGDQAQVNIVIADGASLEGLQWDARGNSPQLSISGPKDSYRCPASSSKKASAITCQ